MQASGCVSNCLVSQSLEMSTYVDVVSMFAYQCLGMPEQTADPRANRIDATTALLVPWASSSLFDWRDAIFICVGKYLLILTLFAQNNTTACAATSVALHDWKFWEFHVAFLSSKVFPGGTKPLLGMDMDVPLTTCSYCPGLPIFFFLSSLVFAR